MAIRELLASPAYNASWNDNIVVNGRFSVEERVSVGTGRGLPGFYCSDYRKTLYREVGHWRNGWWVGMEEDGEPTIQQFAYSLRNGSPTSLVGLNETKDGEGCRFQNTRAQATLTDNQLFSPLRTVLPVDLMRAYLGKPMSLSFDFMAGIVGKYAIVLSYPHNQKHTTFFVEITADDIEKLRPWMFNFVLPTDWFSDVTNGRYAPITDPLCGGIIHIGLLTTKQTDTAAVGGKFGRYPGSRDAVNYLATTGVPFYINNVALLPGVSQRPRPDKSQTPLAGLYENIILPEIKGHARKTITQDFKFRLNPANDGAVAPYIRKYGFSELNTVFGNAVGNQQSFDWSPWKLGGNPTQMRVQVITITDEAAPLFAFNTDLAWNGGEFQFCITFSDGTDLMQYHWRTAGGTNAQTFNLAGRIGSDLLAMFKKASDASAGIDVNIRIGRETSLEYFLRRPRMGAIKLTPEDLFAPIAAQPNARPRINAYTKPDVFNLVKYEDDCTGDYYFNMRIDMPTYNQSANFIRDMTLLGLPSSGSDVNNTYDPAEYKLLTACVFDTTAAMADEVNNMHMPMWVQTARGCALRDTWGFKLVRDGLVSPYVGFGQVGDTAVMGRSNWLNKLVLFAERWDSFVVELEPKGPSSSWQTKFNNWIAFELTLNGKSWKIVGYYDAANNCIAVGTGSRAVTPAGYPTAETTLSYSTRRAIADAIIKRVNKFVQLTMRPLHELGRFGLSINTRSAQSGDYYFRDTVCPIGDEAVRPGGDLLPFYNDLYINVGGYGPLRILATAPNVLELTTLDTAIIDHAYFLGKMLAIDVVFLDHPSGMKLTFTKFTYSGTGAKYRAGVTMTSEFKTWLLATPMPLNIELIARLATTSEAAL